MLSQLHLQRRPDRLRAALPPNRLGAAIAFTLALLCLATLASMGLIVRDDGGFNLATLPFLLMPAALVLVAGALLCQRTEIEVDARAVTWKRGPLPAWKEQRIACNDLRGFQLEKVVKKGEHGHRVGYTLLAEVAPAGTLVIASGLPKKIAMELLEALRSAKAELTDRPL